MKMIAVWLSVFFLYLFIGSDANASQTQFNDSIRHQGHAFQKSQGPSLEIISQTMVPISWGPVALFSLLQWSTVLVLGEQVFAAEIASLNLRSSYLFNKTGLSPPLLS